ncbi:MAG: hypothetical protein DRI99_01240 [Candidatus Aminicenantes bacterium]|nr:MAG: hypothetical protein DRJ11_07955 [Candidatus Aminicenantes bacterium]RLE05834.1 MAG: hypothetical protein DRI99_01240 [Candidatus Aminicenantes bacterium]
MKIFTVGHSTRSWPEFLQLLQKYAISLVIDVRAFPSSQRFPHFNREYLARELFGAGISYWWLGRELGGYRRREEGLGENSPNKGWQREGYRIYADYMLSEPFAAAVDQVIQAASRQTATLLCAERLYFRCHRQLIADYLTWKGQEVWHIEDLTVVKRHVLHRLAREEEGRLIYPPPQLPLIEKDSVEKD